MYISGRTVQTHLAHIFAKLDISSRVQLAAGAVGGFADVEDQVARGGQARGHLVAAAEAQRRTGGDDRAVGSEGVRVAEGDEREVHRGDLAAVLDRAGAGDVEGARAGIGGPLLPGPAAGAPGLEDQVAVRAQGGSDRP